MQNTIRIIRASALTIALISTAHIVIDVEQRVLLGVIVGLTCAFYVLLEDLSRD